MSRFTDNPIQTTGVVRLVAYRRPKLLIQKIIRNGRPVWQWVGRIGPNYVCMIGLLTEVSLLEAVEALCMRRHECGYAHVVEN